MGRSPGQHVVLRPALCAVLALAGACHRGGPHEGGGRCEAPTTLPGSVELAPDVQSAIAGREIPAEALLAPRRECNRMVLEPGAFARQHALDPVDWRPWSPQTLAEAARLGRPLFVLDGFSASWPTAQLTLESIGDRRLAREINRLFVPVLLDRDERPDVDAYLMLATEVITGGGGWPAVVFLQADQKPFDAYSWGAASSGQKKLARVVEELRRRLTLGGGSIGERAELVSEKMQRRASLDTGGAVPDAAAVARSLTDYLGAEFDEAGGSFGPPPLFPRAPVLDFLLEAGGEPGARMAGTVLARMREGEIADVVGGGFHRYAAKTDWREPAHEKMLADNAALASVYLRASGAKEPDPLRHTARGILDFLLRDLRLDSGAFAAGLPAMGLDDDGKPCDGCWCDEDDDARRAALASDEARAKALDERDDDAAPRRDERVLADANALAVSALARGSVVLGDSGYLDAAVAAAGVLDTRLREAGFVHHCLHDDGSRCEDGYLADQALVALAFLDLDAASAPGGKRWLEAARAIADEMPSRFEHDGTGGFFQTVAGEALPLRLKPDLDAAWPSGNSAAALLYARLAARTGEARYADVARRTFEAFGQLMTLRPLAMPALVTALATTGPKDGVQPAMAPPQLEPAPAVHP